MSRSNGEKISTLASSWSAPVDLPTGEVGNPIICIASTYTFHASFFESELLPRFLGLKFDETEGVRPFVVEREERLAITRACILVDAQHFDVSQSTLRWDQLPVRIPGGAQHSKVVVLLWENCARLIVSSANLTRQGYRRNREIVGLLDFYDHETSVPRRVILDAIGFLQTINPWIGASHAVRIRLQNTLADVRSRLNTWRNMPADFQPRERPRVVFVGGSPTDMGRAARSPLSQLIGLWGTRRASEITVMTPFVGELAGPVDPVVKKLLELPRTREATGSLVIPGQPSTKDAKRMVVGLPRNFLDRWASAWGANPELVPTYVVPLRRDDEPLANRDLHAKSILIEGEGATMLLSGSSNFSAHGMGVGAANAEANLCYLDDSDTKRNGMRLRNRLPVDWEKDICDHPIWPEEVETIDDEKPGFARLPEAFLWALYNQRTAVLTVFVDTSVKLPIEWSLRWPGENSDDVLPLVDSHRQPEPPADGRMILQLTPSLRGANIAALRLSWRDEDDVTQSGTLAVHVESADDLLPPEEFRSLMATDILDCLLSGREPAEWVEALERRRTGQIKEGPREVDSHRAVDTSGYLLYRTRRLGAALAVLGKRLLGTVRTSDSMTYRLRHDPFGPRMLAEALVREWRDGAANCTSADNTVLVFSLAEINLMLTHVARRVTEPKLRPLFKETIDDIERYCTGIETHSPLPPNISGYVKAIKSNYEHLLEHLSGETHAG